MSIEMNRPAATIAIVTRDRRDELRNAVRSALEQEGAFEVLVVDDGSQDGTAEMLREEFPNVRLVRFEAPAGIATRRNDATDAARADVIVSIDDDALFSTTRIVQQTLDDLDHPRIAAVAIPYIDVGIGSGEHQRAPDSEGRWITSIFRATAYAIRRDVLTQVGGFNDAIFHQGEEWDLSLRMLDAGHLIRLGRSAPIHHLTSPRRDLRKMYKYGRRNEVLISWTYFPAPWNLVYILGYAIRGILFGITVGRPGVMIQGVLAGVRDSFAASRRPVSSAAFRFDQLARSRVRANSGVLLAEAEAKLGLGTAPPDHSMLRATRRREARPSGSRQVPRWLYTPARDVRTKLVARLGRPVRCEACGEILFRGVPFIWKGRLKFLGAESALVRADWDKMNRMTLRHVERDRCTPRMGSSDVGRRAEETDV